MLVGSAPKSHTTRNLFVVVVVLILAVGGLIGYSYTQLSGKITGISYGGLTWAQPSAGVIIQVAADLVTGNYIGLAMTLVTGINLNAQLALTNNGFLPVSTPTETHDLVVNGIDLGSGSTNISASINPSQTVTIPVQQTINTASITQLAASIVSSDGNLGIQIDGNARVSLLGLPLNIPFHQSSKISLVQVLEQHLQSLVGSRPSQQTNTYNQNPSGSGSAIVSGEYNVSPGRFTSFVFSLNTARTIAGSFSASATLGNNIIVYVLTQNNFALYQNGQPYSAIYDSGKVASGTINLSLASGSYYLVLDNTYSTISTKDVTIQVSVS